jgi:nitrate reductase gamma subunit
VVWIQGGPSGEEGNFDTRAAWKAVWEDAILQHDTWRRDKTRWWAYAGIHYGFFGMLAGFLIVVLVRHIFHPMVFADSAAWTWAQSQGTAPWLGLILDGVIDLFGIFALVGILLAMGRRWVWPSPLPSHEAEDMFSLFLFLAVVVTGFAVEAAKLAPLVPEAAQWVTFVTTAAARIMGRFEVSWTGVHYYLWLIHLAVTFIFLAYLPYGKLFHAITSPVSVALEAGREKGH